MVSSPATHWTYHTFYLVYSYFRLSIHDNPMIKIEAPFLLPYVRSWLSTWAEFFGDQTNLSLKFHQHWRNGKTGLKIKIWANPGFKAVVKPRHVYANSNGLAEGSKGMTKLTTQTSLINLAPYECDSNLTRILHDDNNKFYVLIVHSDSRSWTVPIFW